MKPSTKWVRGEGPLAATILFVGQSPGQWEAARRRPFVGPAGRMLDSCLEAAGIDRNTVRLENALPYPILGPHKVDPADLKKYAPRMQRIISHMPNLRIVVALGNDAMRALVRQSGITAKRGEEIELGSHLVLPTFHPSYVLRRQSARATLVHDLVRARRLAAGEEMAAPAQSIVFAGEILNKTAPGVLAFDVETNEHDRPRLYAVGQSPSRIAILSAEDAYQLGSADTDGRVWVGHNIKADLRWMRLAGVRLENGRLEDTMLMAHLLDENRSMSLKKLALELIDPNLYWKYVEPRLRRAETRGAIPYEELGTYCAHDVAATLLIYDRLKSALDAHPSLQPVYRHISLPLIDALLEMEMVGVPFSQRRAARMLIDQEAQLSQLDEQLYSVAGINPNWNSWQQVSDVLYNRLGLKKPAKTSAGGTGVGTLMAIRDQHPLVPLLLRRRKLVKRISMVRSWADAVAIDGRLYPTTNMAATVTGRISYHRPNLQQVHTEAVVRSLFRAREGYVILAADYKTLEIGVGAWIYAADDLLQAYLSGDVHTYTATALLGRPPADSAERKKAGKTPNFGLLYQQSDQGFRDYAEKMGMSMTLEEAAELRARWHMLYPGVRQGWRQIGLRMQANGGTIAAPSGRERRLPEFLSGNRRLVNEAWRQGCNMPVQTTAAEITHVAAILAQPRMKADYDADLILHVHDALIFEVPVGREQAASAQLKYLMETAVPAYFERYLNVKIPIPLRVDVGTGPSWGELAAI